MAQQRRAEQEMVEQENIIRVNNLFKQVEINNGTLDILKSISFNVKRGETIAIVGASGSGKSTLLGLLAGLDSPTQGQIFIAGEPLHLLGEEQRTALRRHDHGASRQAKGDSQTRRDHGGRPQGWSRGVG